MKKISNKGFTLIELLATILIIGLVLGVTTYGIIISVNKAKEKGTILSLASIKEAARTYSGELGEDSWKNGDKNTYFCVTIEELINKGLLNKNANSVENGGEIVDYVVVIKNKTTKVIEKEEILTESNSGTAEYQICTGNIKNEDITTGTKITNRDSSTDEAYINFTDAYSESEDIVIIKKYCKYSDSSTKLDSGAKEGTITDDNKCILEGLTQNTKYWVRVCEETERGSVSCDTGSVTTKNIVAPTIAVDTNKNNSVKITYDNSNNNSNIKGEAFYYFKSTIDGTSSVNVSTCRLNDNKYTCEEDSVNNITGGTWYRTTSEEISITYSTPGDIKVTAETRDKSNNSNSSTKEFSLYKTTFNRGNADTIGGQTNNIELMCLANKGKTCNITSPSIEKSEYQVIGWNETSSETKSSWDVNTTKSIKTTTTYYPILKLNVVKIYFKTEGGTVTENNFSADEDGYIYRNGEKYFMQINYGESLGQYGLSDYNNKNGLNISKTGDTAASGAEWKCLNGCTKSDDKFNQASTYDASDFCDASNGNCEVTLGVNWTHNKVNIRFNTKGGTVTENNFSADKDGYIYRSGEIYLMQINYGESLGQYGLSDYNNKNGLNISKTGYTAASGKEWCLSDNCEQETYDQEHAYSASAFCDASNGDCTVTLGVNWTPNTYTISYSLNSGNFGTNHPTSGTYDKDVSISNPTRKGYKFSGWKITGMDSVTHTYGTSTTTSTSISSTNATTFKNLRSTSGTVNFEAQWIPNKVIIKFNTMGGTVTENNFSADKDGYIYRSGEIYLMQINYGESLGQYGLSDYNNKNGLNISKTGYTAASGKEWCLSDNCEQETYDQEHAYSASAFCNASNGDCTVTLGVNWTPNTYTISYSLNSGNFGTNHPTSGTYDKDVSISNPTRKGYKFSGWKITGMDSVTHTYGTSTTTSTSISSTNATTFKNLRSTSGTVKFEAQWTPNKVIIKFNTKGGTVSEKNNFSQIGDSVYRNNKEYLLQINYGGALDGDGLPDYNNEVFLNISKTESIGVSEKEWKCLSGCKNSDETFDQASTYNASAFCDASNGDCTVTLGVNWEGYKVINDYRCVGSDYYYVTFCRGDYCYYNKKNCEKYIDNSGTLLWSNVDYCSPETIKGERCDVKNNDKYFITVCTGGFCKYQNNNAISDIERCDLKPCPSTETGSGSGTSTTEKSGRCGGCVTNKDCVNASTTCNVKCINLQCVWFPYKADKQTCSTVGMMCY